MRYDVTLLWQLVDGLISLSQARVKRTFSYPHNVEEEYEEDGNNTTDWNGEDYNDSDWYDGWMGPFFNVIVTYCISLYIYIFCIFVVLLYVL